jgi:NAD(P) transhydrogenase subunit beta
VSFWGSNIAFGKLQEILPGRPVQLPGQQFINIALLAVCVGCAVAIASGTESEGLFIAILVAAALLGNMFVLPIGGADMPVVISLLNAFTGLSAAAAGLARRLGLDPHEADGRGHEPLDPQHLQGRIRWRWRSPSGGRR